MSLTIPILNSISPFDATQSYTVTFNVLSGDQVTGNILNVYKNSDNTLVYTNTVSSLLLSNTIPANTLTNGTFYKCTITTQNSLAQSSTPSSSTVFLPLSPASITVTNIDGSGKVYNQNVTFSATYTQPQNELLQQYEYYLYDNNKNLLQSYPVQYTASTPLTQSISNLNNGVVYYVRILTISVNGQSSDSGYVQFTPQYVTLLLNSTLTATNIPSTGSVQIQANIIQVLGTMTAGTPTYTNSTWIDLTNGQQVTFQQGFNINQDNFILKLWCKNIPNDKVFLTIKSNSGHIDLEIDSNQVHVFRYLNNCSVVAHFVSNTYTFVQNVGFMIYVKSLGGLMDISVQSS